MAAQIAARSAARKAGKTAVIQAAGRVVMSAVKWVDAKAAQTAVVKAA